MKERPFNNLSKDLARIAIEFQTEIEIDGKENLPETGPLIVTFNHPPTTTRCSFLALAAVIAHSPWEIKNIVPLNMKGYRISNRMLVGFFEKLGVEMVPIRDDNSATSIPIGLVRAKKALEQGKILIVSPEGKGKQTGKLGMAQRGTAWLAMITNAPILPIGLVQNTKRRSYDLLIPKQISFRAAIGQPFRLQPREKEPKIPTNKRLQVATFEIMNRIAELIPLEMRGHYSRS